MTPLSHRRTSADARADRFVDATHVIAARKPDPVAYLRAEQATAERIYAETGTAYDLAVCRAFGRSLDGDAR